MFLNSLSGRFLALTILFVMLAEVLIYAPSVGRFRLVYLEERLAAAHLAILGPSNRVLVGAARALVIACLKRGPPELGQRVRTCRHSLDGLLELAHGLTKMSFLGLFAPLAQVLAVQGPLLGRVLGQRR